MRRLTLLLVAGILGLGFLAGCGGDDDDDDKVADVGDVADVGEDVALPDDVADEDAMADAADPVDVGGVGGEFTTSFAADRTVDSLSDADRLELCVDIGRFMEGGINHESRIEWACFGRGLSRASFEVVDGDADELRRVCGETFDDCVLAPPPTVVDDPAFAVGADFCPWVGVECPATVELVGQCYEGYVAYFNEHFQNAPTCSDLTFDDFGQVQILHDFEPDPELLWPCIELSILCEDAIVAP